MIYELYTSFTNLDTLQITRTEKIRSSSIEDLLSQMRQHLYEARYPAGPETPAQPDTGCRGEFEIGVGAVQCKLSFVGTDIHK